jgi:protoporphyrin/coproporphyrin ferrochelatase
VIDHQTDSYDAILVVGFGGPEKKEDVMPFLENVTRGRNIPRERLEEVAEHYYHYEGISPINQQVRDLLQVLKPALQEAGVSQPIYWGNRNWHPMLEDTVAQMKQDGVDKVLGLVLAGYSSYSSCRQYREDMYRAGETSGWEASQFDKIRVFFNHPDFVEANADHVKQAAESFGGDPYHLVFTAHSIPNSMSENCDYELQLTEASRLVAEAVGLGADDWKLVYQSRSGRPQDPWLDPDICDYLKDYSANGVKNVVVLPIGFLSDHMEVMFDLDEEAQEICAEVGLNMQRAATVGLHPKFINMLVELIQERTGQLASKQAIGQFGPNHDVCPFDCCPAPARRPAATRPE